jgi:hypothetical protein
VIAVSGCISSFLLEATYLALELVGEVVDEPVVEVLATQMGVSGSRLDLEDTVLDSQEGHIESTTAKIKDEDIALASLLLVETVCDGSRGRLVDDAEDVETRDKTSILGGLTLRVVEVGGDSHNSVVNRRSQVTLCCLTHLYKD